jgi:hypothetical protein
MKFVAGRLSISVLLTTRVDTVAEFPTVSFEPKLVLAGGQQKRSLRTGTDERQHNLLTKEIQLVGVTKG